MLTTQFVALEIERPDSVAALHGAIAQRLRAIGEPLRWAITAIDADRQVVRVEAVVTVNPLQTIGSPQSVLSV